MKYRKKQVVIEANQWFKNGDHPEDNCETLIATGMVDLPKGTKFFSEGQVVRYYRHPQMDGQEPCKYCGVIMHDHGWIDTLEGGHIVCPGDFVVTGVKGGTLFLQAKYF